MDTTNLANNPAFESSITVALVKRVSRCVAIGIPLKLALAHEGIVCEDYEAYLREQPDLAILADVARCEFLEYAIATLLTVKNPSSNIRWLLERLYPGDFGKPNRKETKGHGS